VILRRIRRRSVVDPAWQVDSEHGAQLRTRVDAACALVANDPRLIERIAGAPPAYLMVHTSSVIVRHCEMLEPRPRVGETRVVITPTVASGRWHLDVATADQAGLLAAFTGVLHEAGIDVKRAVIATWPDGGALQSFVVSADRAPDPGALERSFSGALGTVPRVRPLGGARVTFDQTASPLYTACQVQAVDEPGLLHAITTAMAAADVDIHAARVTTVDGMAVDHFDLSDRAGHKLDRSREDAIVAGLTAVRVA
jgi:UTP:GlnB (protein PII) uridylyltransferase